MDKENKQLSDEQLENVSGGSGIISWEDLKGKINQVVNFVSVSEGIDCNVRIIKVNAVYHEYYSKLTVCAYAADELSYNMIESKRLDSDIIRAWDCDGVCPQDVGLGYGKRGFRFIIEYGEDVYFHTI